MQSHTENRRNSGGGSPTRLSLGVAALLVSAFAAVMMALEHLGGIALPGCGEGSACAELADSAWSKIPILNWPVAYLGVAYFAGALVAWFATGSRLPALLRNVTRAGALASVLFVIVMIAKQQVCSYCLATHAGNLVFWLLVEAGGKRGDGTGARPIVLALLAFVVVSAGLGIADGRQRAARQQRGETELNESIGKIIAATTQRTDIEVTTAPSEVPDTQPANESSTTAASPEPVTPPFTGRYRRGPEKAAIRVVVFSSFQCKDCRRVEAELHRVFEQRDDMSISMKHFPMCPDCNPYFTTNPHPNSCWGARAAEAAGILRGNDGFWEMHDWLFKRGGGFTSAQLHTALQQFGYDVAEFQRIMMGDETLALVQADIDEGFELGLHYTPMIFINGVEFKGWYARDAVARAIRQVAAENPPPLTAENDHPVPAAVKYVEDWREQRKFALPPDNPARQMGSPTPKLDIVAWGDYQEPFSARVDQIIRDYIAVRDDARYTFRHYPVNQECNPQSGVTKHEHACRAHQAAAAAGILGGTDAYWRMHVWLFENLADFSDERLRAAADEMGLDASAFFAALDTSAVANAITSDAAAGKRVGLRAVPTVFINGRRVPRWQRQGESVLESIMDEAVKEPAAP